MRLNVLPAVLLAVLPIGARAAEPFATLTAVDAAEIAGRPVQLDAQGKLLPWPQADDTGYSYSAHVLSQWAILQDQFQRQRLPYFYCCVDFDRSTFELVPDRKWVNSTAYLRCRVRNTGGRDAPAGATLPLLVARRRRVARRASPGRTVFVGGSSRDPRLSARIAD